MKKYQRRLRLTEAEKAMMWVRTTFAILPYAPRCLTQDSYRPAFLRMAAQRGSSQYFLM